MTTQTIRQHQNTQLASFPPIIRSITGNHSEHLKPQTNPPDSQNLSQSEEPVVNLPI